MKLIINGDDFGYTKGNTYGIIEGFNNGILRSTTVLMNTKYIDEVQALAKKYPDLGMGVHLNLTLGKPLTSNETLTDKATGKFYSGRTTVWSKNPDYNEIEAEWRAQIEKFIEVFGKKPTHLDSHHSVHDATPEALSIVKKLAGEYNLPIRRYCSYEFVTGFFGDKATKETMINLLKENKDKDIEIMVHPGYCDLELYRDSSYALNRVVELDVICDPEVKKYIEDNNVELCHF